MPYHINAGGFLLLALTCAVTVATAARVGNLYLAETCPKDKLKRIFLPLAGFAMSTRA